MPFEGCSQLFKAIKQRIKEERLPCGPGKPKKQETVVTETRNCINITNILKYTSDVLYPRAEKIILVTDNLDTHAVSSLYKAFRPEETCRLAERSGWHYTPEHGSWLDMAEIEIGIMSRQAVISARMEH
ncbi:MAG: hypothetical protein HFH56_02950 [Lachnospiraceae bacterium]|nr:hypothetical protein [Lachnospiraceae bacterium]